MTVCHHCGQPKTDRAQRGGLLITREPNAIYWQGILQPKLPPMQHNVLFLLAQRGVATFFALELTSSGATTSVKVCAWRLRRWLRAHEIPLTVKAERGVGYRLEADKTLSET